MFSLGGRHSIQAVRASDGAHLSSGFYHTHGTMPRKRMTRQKYRGGRSIVTAEIRELIDAVAMRCIIVSDTSHCSACKMKRMSHERRRRP